ncbi:hypothetical protein [Stutzerimonas stutzeri]|uniref:hypothetical protein n=1 Tax=Stutzerimonas stutzeri TaxID=316 RepID=UPI001C2E0988|nr:hypothetical protein [Stutzerimonas stutzeri]
MSFTAYQFMAFIGGFAGTAIFATLGYIAGRRAHRQEISRICQARADENELWRHKLKRSEHEHTLSRLNAAQAIEALTEESDLRSEELTRLRAQVAEALAAVSRYNAVAISEEDAAHLTAIAAKLSLAAQTFGNLGATDQAKSCEQLAAFALAMFNRYWAAQTTLAQEQVA